MIRVACYARYSSEHQKESSITDQFRNCETRAAREGWTITARYEDKAISGTTADRPGYQALLKDAKAKQFDILLVDDLSRLSRDSVESEQARRRFVFWKIRLIGVTDGIDTAVKGHEMMSGFHGLINQQYVSGLRDKIARGMQGQALQGRHCGGRTYGYKLVPILDPTKTDPDGNPVRIGTQLAINPEQTKWVRWIFERYAEGMSPVKIVNELNRQQVPAPGAAFRRRKPGVPTWSAGALQGNLGRGTGLLNNPLYIGRYIWNRRRREKDPDSNSYAHVIRDRAEWVEAAVPHLRIIDEDLWERVKAARASVSRGVYALRAFHGRARSTGARPKYLFSGLLVCGHCGGKFVISSTATYVCSTWRTRGESVCPNALKVPRKLVESFLLAAIQKDLFTDEGLAVFKREVARRLAEHRRMQRPDGTKDAARLQAVEQEIVHIMTAIKAGIFTPSTKAALEQAEAERDALLQTVQSRATQVDKIVTFLPEMERRFKAMIDELATVTQHQVDKARGILRDLIGGTIPLHPTADGAEPYLTAEVSGDYSGLARLALGPKIILKPVDLSRSKNYRW